MSQARSTHGMSLRRRPSAVVPHAVVPSLHVDSIFSSAIVKTRSPKPISRLQNLLRQLPKIMSKPLETFTIFPELPDELRGLIWKAACFEPIKVRFSAFLNTSIHSILMKMPEVKAKDRVPAILHTTSESRLEALRWYKATRKICPPGDCQNPFHDRFPWHFDDIYPSPNVNTRVSYFNPAADTYIYSSAGGGYCDPPWYTDACIQFTPDVFSGMKSLQIDLTNAFLTDWNELLLELNSLVEVTLVRKLYCKGALCDGWDYLAPHAVSSEEKLLNNKEEPRNFPTTIPLDELMEMLRKTPAAKSVKWTTAISCYNERYHRFSVIRHNLALDKKDQTI
ncbi:hypothetical protein WAI453_011675 [Rhynchosporium graminicola]|uniref:2EXR domain-containing protein n=1 Tax=Rhynchosporium graminicola TaxID=2792576 RepID=A0A1E1JZX8_9HELO|nr:uncharacterized protein RCO7_07100 [Rhynchosporium commune]